MTLEGRRKEKPNSNDRDIYSKSTILAGVEIYLNAYTITSVADTFTVLRLNTYLVF